MSNTNSISSVNVQIFSQFSQQVNETSTPKTLRIMLNLLILISLIMLFSSSIILYLALENIESAKYGVEITRYTFESLFQMTTIRLLIRSLTNIAQKYQSDKSIFISSRSPLYLDSITHTNEKMIANTILLTRQSDEFGSKKLSQVIQVGMLS